MAPSVNIEDADNFEISVALPGLDKRDIWIESTMG